MVAKWEGDRFERGGPAYEPLCWPAMTQVRLHNPCLRRGAGPGQGVCGYTGSSEPKAAPKPAIPSKPDLPTKTELPSKTRLEPHLALNVRLMHEDHFYNDPGNLDWKGGVVRYQLAGSTNTDNDLKHVQLA